MFALIAHMLTVKADTQQQDYCSYVCGSIANSPNPTESMNKLLASGINCSNAQNYPLNKEGSFGGMPAQASCIPNYNFNQPQQPAASPYAPMSSYPGQQPAQGYPASSPQAQEECEITVTSECKPKTGAPSQQQPMQGTPANMPTQQQPGFSISPYDKQPGTTQQFQPVCDCSKQQQQQQGSMYQPMTGGSGYKMCDCSQQMPTGGSPQYPGMGGSYPQYQQYPQAQTPNFCTSGSSSGSFGGQPLNKQQPISNNVLANFNCDAFRPNEIYGNQKSLTPVVIGTNEFLAAPGFNASSSSCGVTKVTPCY